MFELFLATTFVYGLTKTYDWLIKNMNEGNEEAIKKLIIKGNEIPDEIESFANVYNNLTDYGKFELAKLLKNNTVYMRLNSEHIDTDRLREGKFIIQTNYKEPTTYKLKSIKLFDFLKKINTMYIADSRQLAYEAKKLSPEELEKQKEK